MPTPPDDLARDEEALAGHARVLADGIEAALPGWVVACVERVLAHERGAVAPDVIAAAREAGERARREVGPRVRALLETDIDEQPTNPLSLVRGAVVYPTEVLRAAGATPVPRDPTEERLFADDLYRLAPAAFADLDPALHEPGIAWGAAKAYVHLARRRARGRTG